MLFYFIFGGILILISGFSKSKQFRVRNCRVQVSMLLLVYAILALFIGLRDSLGLDDQMYITCFEQIKRLGYTWRDIEKVFVWLSNFSISIGATYQLVFLLFSSISCFLLYCINVKFVNKQSYSIFIAIFLSFCFLDSFTLMRQFLAICLMTFFYVEMKNNNKLIAIVLMVISFLVHRASLIVVGICLLLPMIKKIKTKIKIEILLLLYLFQYVPVAKFVQNIISNTFLDNYYYLSYYLGSRVEYRFFDNKIGIVTTVYLILYCFIIWKREKNLGNNLISLNVYDDDLSAFSFVYFVLLMAFSQFGYATRIAYYFSIFTLAYLSNNILIFIKSSDRKYARLIFNFVLLLLFLYSVYSFCDSEGNRVLIPYKMNYNLFN